MNFQRTKDKDDYFVKVGKGLLQGHIVIRQGEMALNQKTAG